MSASLDEDLTVLESLDFDISCQYNGRTKGCSAPAVFIIFFETMPCLDVDCFYICGDCWKYRNSTGFVLCAQGHRHPCMDYIIRVERV